MQEQSPRPVAYLLDKRIANELADLDSREAEMTAAHPGDGDVYATIAQMNRDRLRADPEGYFQTQVHDAADNDDTLSWMRGDEPKPPAVVISIWTKEEEF